ncbi:nucleolar complex protein 4 homolog [Monodelphis domestica]|uniref:nucleolar complex protein 4 homolog n=1 Tax=Monodelphis domestica TaxID=13616 RepID=UPI0024E2640B|nr:nucleolar complex protein 4 homolog [Monodelphis domestica]
MASESGAAELGRWLETALKNRRGANVVFDILGVLQADQEDDILNAIHTCSRLFGALLERGELFVGHLPEEEATMAGSGGALRKYKVWMRHRYNSCCNRLAELLGHRSFKIKELALCTLMKFVQLEGAHPLEKSKWDGNYLFPRGLLLYVVEGLIPTEADSSLLISRFQEYLEHDDIRYHTMQATVDLVARVTDTHQQRVPPMFWNNTFTLISAVSLPRQQSDISNFYVKHKEMLEKWKVTQLKEHKHVFEKMWFSFLKHKLPVSLYKKVLVIMHDSILPHMSQPSLMIDFLTSAYDIGGAISLLALNGLFILIHQHNLEYPEFYRKLYSLLDPSVFHVKYRARFFHLADLFLSSSHLPAYLVAAFAKRLCRLSLTAPPEALLMVIPFICNLLRRHPACKALIHRPSEEANGLTTDPYDMEEEDPAKSHALESCLWELKSLQRHYHPEVAKAAMAINQALSPHEVSIAQLLELSPYEIFEKDFKKEESGPVPLEFIQPQGLLGRRGDLCVEHFALD